MPREETFTNMPYDEALELSGSEMSLDDEAKAERAFEKSNGAKHETGGDAKEVIMMNDKYDEAHELESEDSVDTDDERLQRAKQQEIEERQALSAAKTTNTSSKNDTDHNTTATNNIASSLSHSTTKSANMENESDESDQEESQTGANLSGSSVPKPEGAYDPNEYKDLNVSTEVRDLFQYITRYNAHEVELESTLRCFVPDYIPAVGEMDPFIKVPRPDGELDNLGLICLDEPAAAQSDATVLELQLRAVSKKQHGDVAVRSIEDAQKNPIEIDRWIHSIAELHRSKPQAQVNFRKPMPDIETLMQEWSPEIEDVLQNLDLMKNTNLADIDATLPEFIRTACALIDIPVYDNLVESLHILFSLYLEFVENPHFSAQRSGLGADLGVLSPHSTTIQDEEEKEGELHNQPHVFDPESKEDFKAFNEENNLR
uniref:Intraflagellar transport protein 46 homolog n=1 Tax=Aureoumbra lagunensis TaxID=44058 RepID=A0A7S3JRL4_9STRA|mmetsp:Transcript_19212/g.29126  ORF Transcript_19212/g.29126 Transcript_19212/m.29126 type:complete len:430 (-) Transcript_19212:173-1462(-)